MIASHDILALIKLNLDIIRFLEAPPDAKDRGTALFYRRLSAMEQHPKTMCSWEKDLDTLFLLANGTASLRNLTKVSHSMTH